MLQLQLQLFAGGFLLAPVQLLALGQAVFKLVDLADRLKHVQTLLVLHFETVEVNDFHVDIVLLD